MSNRVPTDPRISRRRRAVERSRRRRIWVRLAAAAGAAAVAWIAFWSPALSVRTVDVIGARHVSADEVARVTGVRGKNLLLLSAGEVARSVESLAWVRRARVERILPATVRVRILERRPALVVATATGDRWLVDVRGRVLDRAHGKKDLPVLTGTRSPGMEAGASLTAVEARGALRSFRHLPTAVRRRVVAILAPSAERITFSLAGGTQIRYGAAERLAAKNAVLRALLGRLRAEGRTAAYLDVRVPTSPAIAAAPAASPTP